MPTFGKAWPLRRVDDTDGKKLNLRNPYHYRKESSRPATIFLSAFFFLLSPRRRSGEKTEERTPRTFIAPCALEPLAGLPTPCPLPALRGEGGRRPGEGWFMGRGMPRVSSVSNEPPLPTLSSIRWRRGSFGCGVAALGNPWSRGEMKCGGFNRGLRGSSGWGRS